MERHYLAPLFDPQSIAIFTSKTIKDTKNNKTQEATAQAKALLTYLNAQPYKGKIFNIDVNSSATFSELATTKADLALIALPDEEIDAALELSGRVGVKAAAVLSSGITAARAKQMHAIAKSHGFWLLGPNTQGFQRHSLNLNASIAGELSVGGQLALVSQSGALTASILDWAKQNQVGFSSVISLGAHSQVGLWAVLDFLANDRHTQGIVVYMEGITNARRFMSALRAAAIAKPVVVLKAGRRLAGNTAAQTHSGAIVGSDEVFDAVLRRAGAVRVRSFVELFSAAKCLAARYRPVGSRLGIVTNGGGPGVLAADWACELGLSLGTLSQESIKELQNKIPSGATLTDLIDLSEDAEAEHFKAALEVAAKEKQIDGILALYSPKFGKDAQSVAKEIASIKTKLSKPIVACWMGDASVAPARQTLAAAQVPNFRTPEAAVGAFGNIASFYQNQQLLQQTPPPLSNLAPPDVEAARLLIESVLTERRTILTEMESKALLAAFHIPVTQTLLARSANEAMMIATQIGFPVALKINSVDITHKSDVGGVALNLMNGTSVRDAYQEMIQNVKNLRPDAKIEGITVQAMAKAKRGRELYIGVVTDKPFGPVIAFGSGGTMIEMVHDHAMELPPLNQFLARRLIERSRVKETLQAWRGAPQVDIPALEQVLLRVSEMVCELPQLKEMDINPIIADENGVVAVDARIVIAPANQQSIGYTGVGTGTGKYSHLSILPYPAKLEQILPLRGGGEYKVRPIHPDDAQGLQSLIKRITPESRYFRFVSSMAELPAHMLAKFTLIDYDREMAMCAVVENPEGGEKIIAVSRYITNPDKNSCEFSLLVDDAYSGQGLGTRMMLSIMDVARSQGLHEIIGLVLTNNASMLKLMRSLGFEIKAYPDDPDFRLCTHAL